MVVGPTGAPPQLPAGVRRHAAACEHRTSHAASCTALGADDETFTVARMMEHLRDHFDSGTLYVPPDPENPKPRSICCHPGTWASGIAASMVVALTDHEHPLIAWCSMSTPCTSVFLPVPVGSTLPTSLTTGGSEEDETSLWWSMRRLAELVELDPLRNAPTVQQTWSAWEAELLAATAAEPDTAAVLLQSRVEELLDKRAEAGRADPRSRRRDRDLKSGSEPDVAHG